MLLLFAASLASEVERLPGGEWELQRWTSHDGLHHDDVIGLSRRDGYLLVETRAGVQRFDGHEFVDAAGLGGPPEPRVRWEARGELALRDGGLVADLGAAIGGLVEDGDSAWLATEVGLVHLRKALVRLLAPAEGPSRMDATRVDRFGVVWGRVPGVGWWSPTMGWYRVAEPALTPEELGSSYPFELPGSAPWAVFAGRLYQRTDNQLPRRFREVEGPAMGSPRGFGVRLGGGGWVWNQDRALEFVGGAWRELNPPERVGDLRWLRWEEERALFVDDGPGMVLASQDDHRRLTQRDGLPSDQMGGLSRGWGLTLAFTEDRGLCLRPEVAQLSELADGAAWRCLGSGEGLPDRVLAGEARADLIWVCTAPGIFLLDTTLATEWMNHRRDDVPVVRIADGGSCPNIDARLFGYDDRGRMLFPTQAGIGVFESERLRLPPAPGAVQLTLDGTDADGNLPPTGADARLRWTVPELRWAQSTEARWRMDGGEWSPATTTRAWTLPLPSAAAHVIEVQARLGGDWGPAAELRFARLPRLWEHAWLPWAAVAAGLGGLWALAAARNRRLRESRDALDRAVRERTADLDESHRRLAELLATRSELIANLSHELRTPLMLVLGALEESGGSRPLDRARRNAQRLRELVDQLLDAARLDGGQTVLRPRRVAPHPLAEAILARFDGAAAARHARLLLQPGDLGRVWLDTEFFDKILSNLVSNALSVAPAGSAVTLALLDVERGDARFLRIQVDDEGPGIAPGDRERVFERYVQLDTGVARHHEGLGIGLALVRDLAELHGGRALATEAPGGGARLVVELAVGAEEMDVASVPLEPVPAERPAPHEGPAPDVLVVEDHPDMRAFLVEHLRHTWTVAEAAGGAEGLAEAARLRPAVVVSDVMMPGLDGLSLARALRADPELRRTPIVLVSAKSGPDTRAAALEVADAFLAKPFGIQELRATLAVHLPAPAPRADADDGAGGGDDDAEPPPAAGPAPAPDALMVRLYALADARRADENFGAAELAAAAGMSLRALQRHVRAQGLSPSSFLRERRLGWARDQLRLHPRMTVGEAAAAVGMSRSYFTRAFIAWAGHAPGERSPDPGV